MPLYRRAGSAHWWVRLGRKTRKSTGTDNRAEAEEFEQRERERLWRLAKLGDRSAVTWKDAAARWLKDSARDRRRDREILDWLEPKIGSESVAAVSDPDALEQIRAHSAAEGWTQATTDRIMGTISAVLRKCVEWRYLEHATKVPMYRPPQKEPRFLTPSEFERLCGELPAHLELAARVAVQTMLRMREMLSLTWDRIDLAAKRAWIPGAQMKGARTHGLPLSKESVRLLKLLRKANPDGSHVFQWNGRPVDDCNTKAFQDAVTRAKVGPLRWHDLRHTGASWFVQNGGSLQQLMEFGGWKSYAMVLRYAHLAPDHLAMAAELVGTKGAQRKKRAARKKAKKPVELAA